MSLYITSTSAATLHDVYAIERQPPTTITATGTGTVGIAEQFPWGPVGVITTISDPKTFLDTFAPGGFSRTGAGYMSVMGKAYPTLKVVRILGSTAAAGAVTINKSGPAAMLTVTLNSKGTAGNSVTATVEDATDGDANHFNLTVTITGPSGTTSDKFENLNYSGTGSDSVPDCTKCLLVGSIAKVAAGLPIRATTSFSGGTNGTITAPTYVGTAGSGDVGIAMFEGDAAVDIVITGDPGSSMRAAVNAGLIAHAELMTDRIAIINHDSGQTAAAVRTDVASYRSLRGAYIDVWAYQRDDEDGTERLVAPAPFAASVMACLSPSTSMAWKGSPVKALLGSITKLEAYRGQSAYQNTLAGVCTLTKESTGGFVFEAAVNTNAPSSPSKKNLTRTRMGQFIARSIKQSLRENVDLPNVPTIQQDEVTAVYDFLNQLKRNAVVDPVNLPHILDFGIRDLQTFNSAGDLAAGTFTIPADIKLSAAQERIFLSLQYGETVTITAAL